ncbi:MAG: ABC transporter permease [Candidatus Binatia bacterium]
MNRFWRNVAAVAYKETVVLRHDFAFISAVLMQPFMMLALYGSAISNTPANVPWAVLDRSQTVVSRRLVRDIAATGYFLEPRRVASYEAAQALLQHARALAVVVIPPEFRRAVEQGRPEVQLLLDGTDPLSAARVGAVVGEVAAVFDPRSRRSVPAPRAGPALRQRFWFNPTLRDRNFFLAGLMGMLLTNLCLSATSLGIVAEREAGTYEQMLAQPTRALEIVLGKLAPHVVVSYGVLGLTTVMSGLVYDFWPRGSLLALGAVTLPFVLASLAIGVFVSTLAHTSAQAVFVSVFFILPSFVLSGSIMPYQLMAHPVREIGFVFPLRWYQIATRRLIERGAGFGDVLGPMVALGVIFALLLLAIRARMKPRLG